MFRIYLVLAAFWLVSCGQATPPETVEQLMAKDVYVGIEDLDIPSGQTTDSNAYVIVHGEFVNSCYVFQAVEVTHLSDTVHKLQTRAILKDGMCAMVITPYAAQAYLGRLAEGRHTVRIVKSDGTTEDRDLEIGPSF